MVQQTVNILNTKHRATRDSRCVSAVSLAAPMSTNWPLEPGSELLGVAVKGDMILWLGMNHFTVTETALSRQAEAEVAGFERLISVFGSGPRVSAKLAQLKWGIRLHGAVASYMQQAETRQVIRSGIQAMANRSCSAGVRLEAGWLADDGSGRGCGGSVMILLRPEIGAWNIQHYQNGDQLLFSGAVAPTGNSVRYQTQRYRSGVITDGKEYAAISDERWDISLTRNANGGYSASTQYTWIESGYWDRNEQYTCTAIMSAPTPI